MASWSNELVSWGLSGDVGNIMLIVVDRVCARFDVIVNGAVVNVHVTGHLVKEIRGSAQSTSGL